MTMTTILPDLEIPDFRDDLSLDLSSASNEAEICCPTIGVPTVPTTLVDPLQNPVENGDFNVRDVDQLRLYIEKECFEGSKWSHPIMFKGSTNKTNFLEMDVIKYVGNTKYKEKEGRQSYRVYFDPNKYPVTEEFEALSSITEDTTIQEKVQSKFKSSSYMKLSRDLRQACATSGFNIVLNGNQKFNLKRTGLQIRSRFSCQRYTLYKGSKKDITGNREYRRYTLHNDRKNQRSKGRSKCRRGYSARSRENETRCKFFFYIDFDTYGFYVEPGLGNKDHTHHHPINRNFGELESKKDIQDDDAEFIKDMADGQAQDSQIQNIVFKKTGKLIPTSTIRQITHYQKRNIVNESDFTDIFENKDTKELSPTEHMMRYCRSKNYNFQLLLNDPLFSAEPTAETYTNDKEEPEVSSILDFNEREMDKLKNNVDFGRVAMDLQKEQKYMMSFAWVNPKEIYLLEAFPEVVMIDTTEKTNNEKRPLLTAGGKDSHGNMFIFLRVFMPNQQSWMFRWIFSVVFPSLIPKHILSSIKVVITDGDPQEFLQIDNAIGNVLPNARRI